MGTLADSPPGHPEVERIVAPNGGPLTLDGTNTYVVGAGATAWVIDPGPAVASHLGAIAAAVERRGECAGILLTHSHSDHSEAATELGAPLLWGTVGTGDEGSPESGAGANDAGWPPEPPSEPVGPFGILPTPGHAVDHVCLLLDRVLFSGDLILGSGSSFVPPDGGSLAAYLDSLARLRELDIELICPGHGPFVTDPAARIAEYIDHRLDRERRLLAAIADGVRSRADLLDHAWDDVPDELRPVAALVLQAHLEKLEAEGRLPIPQLAE